MLDLPKAKAFLAEKNNPFVRVSFHFNPSTISFSKSARYGRNPNQSSKSDPSVQFHGTNATELKLQILLDAVEDQPTGSVQSEVEKLLSWTNVPESKRNDAGASPPELRFTWGALKINKAHTFVGHLEHVDVTYEMFSRDGRPLRASVSLTLKSKAEEVGLTNPTSGAERSRRSHVLRRGETLQSVAYAVYGNAAAWRQIATTNEIDDPFRVAPGRELLLPDAAELSGVAR
jgi:nucleoid-associated protein YgaU